MFDKIRQFFASRRVVDVPPPNTQLPLPAGRRANPANGRSANGHDAKESNDRTAAGGGSDRTAGQVFDEPTEELLKLSEDSERTQPGGGRNPYDTGAADRSGAWKNRMR